MTTFEAILSAIAVVIAAGCLYIVKRIVSTSGRDRPHDPERTKRLIERTQEGSLSMDGSSQTTTKEH